MTPALMSSAVIVYIGLSLVYGLDTVADLKVAALVGLGGFLSVPFGVAVIAAARYWDGLVAGDLLEGRKIRKLGVCERKYALQQRTGGGPPGERHESLMLHGSWYRTDRETWEAASDGCPMLVDVAPRTGLRLGVSVVPLG
jgi:hypothetical protein